MNKQDLISNISSQVDIKLFELLIDEYINLENRFVFCDWEPLTLDGGQFTEIYSRIIYHLDSGNLNRRKGVNECLEYIEDIKNQNLHSAIDLRAFRHMCKVLRTVYKFRSQRGSIHIDPDYSANEIDGFYLVAAIRWLLAELIRLFWNGTPVNASTIIKEIVNYKYPIIFNGGDIPLIMEKNFQPKKKY
ncbi:MAG TPA: hypothetical protein VMW28_06235 [Pelolinea sp.]|nr:hypothetical protein [Pelolinea sp.]